MKGVVQMYDRRRGYGFIKPETGKNVFFHRRQWDEATLQGEPREGEPMVFEVIDGPRGPRAEKLARAV